MNRTPDEVWAECLAIIRDNISRQSYRTWFEPLRAVALSEEDGAPKLTVQLPSRFYYEWLEEHYFALLRKTITKVLGGSGRLFYDIVIEREDTEAERPGASMQLPARPGGDALMPGRRAQTMATDPSPPAAGPRFAPSPPYAPASGGIWRSGLWRWLRSPPGRAYQRSHEPVCDPRRATRGGSPPRPPLHLRPVHRGGLQPTGAERGVGDRAASRRDGVQPVLDLWRRGAGQDPPHPGHRQLRSGPGQSPNGPVHLQRAVHRRVRPSHPEQRGQRVRPALPVDRHPDRGRRAVLRPQGEDAGAVLPHLQRAPPAAQADHPVDGSAAERHRGHRGAAALAFSVGPRGRRAGTRVGDPHRHPPPPRRGRRDARERRGAGVHRDPRHVQHPRTRRARSSGSRRTPRSRTARSTSSSPGAASATSSPSSARRSPSRRSSA